ncbi:MAG: hypothetical protein HYY78_19140 [Betaproteobacteria bacterium]|nr:hypothetical protein [Betaproteobacteria bacterium]
MLIHATVTVSGDSLTRVACEARLRRLLSAQFLRNEVTEHHGADALCYDLKVEGGIPFPVFAQASQEFPGLAFAAEWVNVAAGEKGSATIVNGRVTGQASERIATRAGDDHPVHVEVAPDGRLTLALTLFRAGREEWRGYALTATRDALLRLLRRPESDAVELYATEGAAEWSLVWSGDARSGGFRLGKLEPPVSIEDAVYQELERIVRRFVSDWIWFASERREDIAVETERYERHGYAVSGANVRSSRLHRILADAGERRPCAYSTLDADERSVKDVILATWAKSDEA